MLFPVAQLLSNPSVVAAIVAACITAAIGAIIAALRYVFGVELVTEPEVDDRIADAVDSLQEQDNEIINRLDKHGETLDRVEALVVGGEYHINDGMLELIETNADELDDQGERITDVERIQLKIRRRQEGADDDDDGR
jgi:erythromycin esterase-like protein